MTATKGLEGIVATASSISSIIDGELTYRGINIDELAENASYEEVVYLLWYGKLPNRKELDGLIQQFGEYSNLPQPIIEFIRTFPKGTNSMAALRSIVSTLALYDEEANDMSLEANPAQSDPIAGSTASDCSGICTHS